MTEEGIVYNTGSDIIYDFYCELCIEDGRQIEAEGYCQDCGEYLCGSCYGGHRKSRPTRHHVLQDRDSMPKDTPLAQGRVNKDIATKCKIHKGEPLKYYCRSHNDLGCASCFIEGHRSCKGIENIAEASENILESREYQTFISKVKSLKKSSIEIKACTLNNLNVSQKCYNDAIDAVREQKEETIRILQSLEEDIVTSAKKMRSKARENMAFVVQQSDAMSEQLEQMLTKLQHLHLSKHVCQLYIAMRELSNDVAAIQRRCQHLESTDIVGTFIFEPNMDYLHHLLSYPGALGKISPKNQLAKRALDINVEAPDDLSTERSWSNCCITGLAVFSNNRLVVTDWTNLNIKLVNTSTYMLMSQLIFNSSPHDVAKVDDYKVVVTFPDSKFILFVEVTNELKVIRKINVRGKCRGLAYSNGRLYVTFVSKTPRLEILDMGGNLIRMINRGDRSKQSLFRMPEYVCASPDGATIYVSDTSRGTVTSLFDIGRSSMAKGRGVVKGIYKDDKLEGPQKVCTDQHGNVYICGCFSRNVHMVTADCRKVKVILSEDEGLGEKVYSLSHCRETDRLFVGCNSRMLKVYHLT